MQPFLTLKGQIVDGGDDRWPRTAVLGQISRRQPGLPVVQLDRIKARGKALALCWLCANPAEPGKAPEIIVPVLPFGISVRSP